MVQRRPLAVTGRYDVSYVHFDRVVAAVEGESPGECLLLPPCSCIFPLLISKCTPGNAIGANVITVTSLDYQLSDLACISSRVKTVYIDKED